MIMSKNSKYKWHVRLMVFVLSFCMVWEMTIPVEAYSKPLPSRINIYKEVTGSSVNSFYGIKTYKLNYNNYKLVKNKTFVLKAISLPANYKVTYRSKDSQIAKVNNRGLVTGVKNGSTTITATVKYNNLVLRRLTCKVTVGPAAVSVVIPISEITMKVNDRKDLKPIIKPKYSTETPTYKSSNTKVVTVSSNGIIKAVRKGTATITATISNMKSDTCTVTVVDASSPSKNYKESTISLR